MKRRSFLTALAAIGGSVVSSKTLASGPQEITDGYGILVDLTQCAGCRACEYACAEVNGLPEPEDIDLDEERIDRRPGIERFVAVSSYDTDAGDLFVRRQCMHCVEPACAAACLTKALVKTEEGPVIWREDKCMGCRYCMISCPFDVPQFEYESANPKIQKCRMCWERVVEGEVPACVENCAGDALTFGKRSELLEIARERIYTNPGQYVSHIYGENEAGGTSVLYLSPVPFEEIGFRTDLGTTSFPEYTRDFLTAVPLVLFLWPSFLLGLKRSTDNGDEAETADLSNGGTS